MEGSLHRMLIAGVAMSLIWTVPATAQRMSGRDASNTPTTNQIVDMADARFAALKASLRLTPDQEKNWAGFQSALHDMAAKRADELNNLRSGRTVAGGETPASPTSGNAQPNNPQANANAENGTAAQNQPNDTSTGNPAAQNGAPDGIQTLRDQAADLSRRADELKTIADKAQPLYASLDDTQRDRLMNFIQSNAGGDQPMQPTRERRRRR